MYLITLNRPFHLTNLFSSELDIYISTLDESSGERRGQISASHLNTHWHGVTLALKKTETVWVIWSCPFSNIWLPQNVWGAVMQVMLGVRQWTNNHRDIKTCKWKLFFDCTSLDISVPNANDCWKVTTPQVTKVMREPCYLWLSSEGWACSCLGSAHNSGVHGSYTWI